MTNKGTLFDKYNELVQVSPSSSDLNDAKEAVSLLHQDDWVRILLVRQLDKGDEITIEIESSLPLRAKGEPSINDGTTVASDLLHGMIRTLNYLLNLEKLGFNLDIIGQDCMWTAFKDVSKPPDNAFFDSISPP
ncbi:MAG: hypothetical protein P1Q69_07265 [Candidatus Thorarchaeota archaeon]|nr:hypothetical protein [Candidatus Thorarchaeota archaeon]